MKKRIGMGTLLAIAGVLAAILFLTCAVNPVTGKKELMLISEQEEVSLGAETDKEICASYGVYEGPALQQYVDRLGQAMCKLTHRPGLEYHFKVLDTPVINAFAVPGGYIYVTRGIMAYLNDEAELAGVVGHELGHVNARHTAQQISRVQLAQLGLGVGFMLSEKLRNYSGLAEFGVGMLFLKFSRDNERQADDLGVEYSTKSSYDADRMAAFFETLERLTPGGSGSGLPDWFSTHPNPVNRIAAVRAKSAEWKGKLGLSSYAVNKDSYLKTVNNIVFGEDPRQGYVEGNAFYHPVLKFTFPVPAGWTVNNTPAQVQIVSEKEDAVMLLTMDDSQTAAQAAEKFVQQTSAAVQAREALWVNGLQSQRMVSRLVSEQDTLAALSYFIAKNNAVFAFHGLSSRENYSQYASTFAKSFSGFSNLTDPAKMNVKPKLLAVRAVTRAGTLESVLKGFGVAADQMENLAILNGMQLADNVRVGTLLKTVPK